MRHEFFGLRGDKFNLHKGALVFHVDHLSRQGIGAACQTLIQPDLVTTHGKADLLPCAQRGAWGEGIATTLCPFGLNLVTDGQNPRRDNVLPAHEPRDIRGMRAVIDFARMGGLLDQPVIHHDHLVGQRDGFGLGVGDVDESDAKIVLQALQFHPHPQPQEFIQRRQRLIQQ